MKIKVPVKDIMKDEVEARLSKTLQSDPENAYTIGGLMVKVFGVNEDDISSKPFGQWKHGQPTLYSRIRNTLNRMVKEGKVKTMRHGKADVYWWK